MIEIIKASAGSGKTFTLAYKYIEKLMWAEREYMLNGRGWVRNVHRRTLAITFTNNSTNEMKQRIVKSLYDMMRGENGKYLEWIDRSFDGKVSRERTMQVAGMLLDEMLEDWQMVRVSTIDSFFNQVVNSFIHELGIDQTPAVDLNSDAIIDQAVDNMLSRLEEVTPEGRALVRFLDGMMNEAMAEGKRWSIRGELKEIASETLRGAYGGLESRTDQVFRLKSSLQQQIKQREREIDDKWNEIRAGIADFDGMNANAEKAIFTGDVDSKTLRGALDDQNKWFRKGKGSDDQKEWISSRFRDIVTLSEDMHYHTMQALLRGMNYTGIIAELSREVTLVCQDNDSIMISTVNELINQIVANSTTPFIYEKTGLGTDHYMIDEFQDTSVTQWQNFVPLIAESNSQGKDSLVVGDVKQSIYRWREGDWRILQQRVGQEFAGQCSESPLHCNYRSREGIVTFNNSLYSAIVRQQSDVFGCSLGVVYADATQDSDKKGGGEVRCLFMKERKRENFYDKAFPRIVAWISSQSGRTAVLVRKNDEARQVAGALAAAGIRFVSAESLLVGNDIAVRFIIAVMRYIELDGDSLSTAVLQSLMRCVTATDHIDHEMIDRVRQIPLDEIAMALVRRYHLDEIDGGSHRIFVYTLADLIRSWVRSNDASLNRWLDYWDERRTMECVPLPDDDEAVVIMTIHKSKGLEFRNVVLLMNNTSWECGISSRHAKMTEVTMPQWIDQSGVERAFINLNGKEVIGSDYDSLRRREWEECCIDELNTMYVATTRAEERLLIVGNEGTEPTVRYTNFCMVNVLRNALQGWGEQLIEQQPETESGTGTVQTVEPVSPREHGEDIEFGSIPAPVNVRVPKSEQQERGNEMHDLLAAIRYEEELPSGTEWSTLLATGWFSHDWEHVWNECDIAYDGCTLRPDRVMTRANEAVVVDWKTGERESKHIAQVRRYCEAISALGYTVRGYLYYLSDHATVEV